MIELWNVTAKPSKPFLGKKGSFLICRVRNVDAKKFVKITKSKGTAAKFRFKYSANLSELMNLTPPPLETFREPKAFCRFQGE